MGFYSRVGLFLLRVSLGWMFFYAGITKVLDPKWSSAGYVKGAKILPQLYTFLLQPNILPVVDLLNKWGLTLIGISLFLGILTRISIPFAILLMILYYLPILQFPYPNPHSYIVDEHIIYISALLVLMTSRADRNWGFGG